MNHRLIELDRIKADLFGIVGLSSLVGEGDETGSGVEGMVL